MAQQLSENNEIQTLMNELIECGINELEVANKFGLSYSTVRRWTTGESKPRPVELKTLKQMLASRCSK